MNRAVQTAANKPAPELLFRLLKRSNLSSESDDRLIVQFPVNGLFFFGTPNRDGRPDTEI
jgi:hypothetical protein